MNDSTLPPKVKMSLQFSEEESSKPPSSTGTATAATASDAKNTRTSRIRRGTKGAGVKKGFGLYDWTRLLRSSKDLARRQGKPIRKAITLQEIGQHNDNFDAWIALRGKVYNITPYLPYHPGGVDIFKGALGKDCTKLFDKYHRWVNIDGLIGPLLIGYLDTSSKKASLKEKEEDFAFEMPAPRPPKNLAPLSETLDVDNGSDLNPWES